MNEIIAWDNQSHNQREELVRGSDKHFYDDDLNANMDKIGLFGNLLRRD